MKIRYQYNYVRSLLKRYGFTGLIVKALERKHSPMLAYSGCYRRYLPTEAELRRQRGNLPEFAPLVSIVVPAYETPAAYLKELIESVLAQSYPNWELCFADGSHSNRVKETVDAYRKEDSRIFYRKLAKNGGISENTNSGFAMAKGEYIALMDHDDLLAKNALYEMVSCLNQLYPEEKRKMALIYSDEDKINGDGSIHSRPHFKPDFNLEFLRHNNYFCHLMMFSKELLHQAGGLKKEYDGAQDYDFVLRCVDAGAVAGHVPKILYHWRIHEGSTAGNSVEKAYAFDNGCRAIEDHLRRQKQEGRAEVTPNLGVYRIEYRLQGSYDITVIAEQQEQLGRIRDYYAKLEDAKKECHLQIQYIKADSLYEGIENERKKECSSGYLLCIRKDVRVNPKDLIETLLRFCQHPNTGAAAAKLVTVKKRVASCGLAYEENGNLIPLNGGLPLAYKGYFLHGAIPQNVSASSFGCVMLRRDALCLSGGMDKNLTGDYQDADYCFRLQELGFGVVAVPGVSCIMKGQKEAAEGKELFYRRWKEKLSVPDPCYNRNLSLQPGRTYAMREQM